MSHYTSKRISEDSLNRKIKATEYRLRQGPSLSLQIFTEMYCPPIVTFSAILFKALILTQIFGHILLLLMGGRGRRLQWYC